MSSLPNALAGLGDRIEAPVAESLKDLKIDMSSVDIGEQVEKEVAKQVGAFKHALSVIGQKPVLDAAMLRELTRANVRGYQRLMFAGVEAYEFQKALAVEDPVIITTNEGSQVRASVIMAVNNNSRCYIIKTLRGSAAASDTEALLSLYEESKKVATKLCEKVKKDGFLLDAPIN